MNRGKSAGCSVLAALVTLFAGDVPVADACTCTLGTYVSPVDGAVGVPLGVEIAVQRAGPDFIPVLRDAQGNAVAVSERAAAGFVFADWVMLRPDQPLQPNSLYQVEYGETITTFTTGRGIGVRLPEPAPITNLSMAHSPFEGSCTNSCAPTGSVARSADIRYEPSDGVAYYEVIFTSQTESWARLVRPGWPGHMNNTVCGSKPPAFLPDEVWCAELVAVALTGERVRADSPNCTQVAGCALLTCEGVGQACLDPDFQPGPTVPFDQSTPPPADVIGGCAAGNSNRGAGFVLLALLMIAAGRRRLRRLEVVA